MFESMDSGVAVSEDKDLDDVLLSADLAAETYMGATNAVTALGNGRLTAGISAWGEITYLRWPSPSYYDHLRYYTFSNTQGVIDLLRSAFRRPKPVRMGSDAPSKDFRRHGRPYEPYPELGSRPGLVTDSGGVTWVGEPTWSAERSYISDSSPILETRLDHELVGLEARDWVDPRRDVLIRKFSIGENAQRFFYHSTFQPSTTHPSERGLMHPLHPDPPDAGFAAVYHPEEDLITHFRPSNPREDEKVRKTLKGGCSPKQLDKLFPEGGIFLTWGFKEHSDEIQVGADKAGNRIGDEAPAGGRADALDGELRGNRSYIGPVDSSICRDVSPGDEVTVLVSSSNRAQKAVEVNKKSREIKDTTLRGRSREWWSDITNKIKVPQEADKVTKRVMKRSIMNLFLGRDKKTGAIVASPARQPAYHFDWPRDGAFFDLALDIAGFPKVVDDHLNFYKETQREDNWKFNLAWLLALRRPFYHPKGHWYSHMTTDGKPGYIRTIPFEIDETALVIWDIWRHEKFLPDSKKEKYRKKYRPVIEKAAEGIMDHISKEKGELWNVFEDDDWRPKSTLHGKTAVLTGLCAAADAGDRWDSRGIKVLKWGNTAKKLRKNILKEIEEGKALKNPGWRGLSWAIWPSPLFDYSTDIQAGQLIERLYSDVKEKVSGNSLGYAYLGEQLWELGIAIREDSERREFLERVLVELTHEVPVPGTDCYGEVALQGDFTGTGERTYQNRTSIPHLWNGVTAYLAATSIYKPKIFDKLRPPRPEEIQS